MGKYYNIKVKMTKNIIAGARYKHKRFKKGRTYTLKRKVTPSLLKSWKSKRNQKQIGYKIISARKIKR